MVEMSLDVPKSYADKAPSKEMRRKLVTFPAKSAHLTLYQEEENEEGNEDDAQDGPPRRKGPLTPKKCKFLNSHLAADQRTKVRLVPKWPAWSCKHDEQADWQASASKGACLTSLRIVMEHVPKYGEGDFLVVEREDLEGKHATQEVWTARKFKPWEITLAPCSQHVVDRHFTRNGSASLRMPEAGPFAWSSPSSAQASKTKTVALDGRYKGQIDAEGSGNLFWNITRTEERKSARTKKQQT